MKTKKMSEKNIVPEVKKGFEKNFAVTHNPYITIIKITLIAALLLTQSLHGAAVALRMSHRR